MRGREYGILMIFPYILGLMYIYMYYVNILDLNYIFL